MPRIRYLKKYTPIEVIYEDENEANDIQRNRERSFNKGISGNSWLSNSTIIAEMSEAKLKQSIAYYHEMSALLETELMARTFQSKFPNTKNQFSNVQSTSRSIRCISEVAKRRKRNKGIFKGFRISAELKEALLQCLEELRI